MIADPRRAVGRGVLRAAALVTLGLLAACAAPGKRDLAARENAWQERREALAELRDWRAVGRIAVSAPGRGGSADLDWRQSPQSAEIRLGGAFGQGAVVLREDRGGAILQRPDALPIRGIDAAGVLARATGWQLPVAHLRRWILGLSEGGERYRLDDRGRLASLDYEGWQVRYLGYREVDGRQLPERINLRRDEVSVSLAIESWNAEVGSGKSRRILIPGADVGADADPGTAPGVAGGQGLAALN